MTPLQILSDVVQIAEMIYRQVQLVESNKKKWRALQEVVSQVVASLRGLRDLPRHQQFIGSLTALQTCLKETVVTLEKMSKMGRAERFFFAKLNQNKIDDAKQEVLELIPLLNLGLVAQQLIDRDRDRQDERHDRQELLNQQEEYLRKAQANLKPRDLEDIIRKQMASAIDHLKKEFQPALVADATPLPYHLMIELHDIIFEEKISTSTTGDIYLGTWQNQPVTIKWLEGSMTPRERQLFIREAKVMSELHNDNIAPFYGACFEEHRMCIVMGYMENGSLLNSVSKLRPAERHAIAENLAQGLIYLHARNMTHGDIQLESVGIDRRNQAKWINFGWVKASASSTLASVGVAHQVSVWQAPETWSNRSAVSPSSDIYSFGWLLWTLVTGQTPYANIRMSEVLAKIQRNERETIPATSPAGYVALITACWATDSTKRPTAGDVARKLRTVSLERPVSPTGEELYERAVTAHKAKKFEEAYAGYSRSYEKGFYKSATSLGLFFLEGSAGQRVDKKKAEKLLEYAAERGHSRAMFNLARMYEKGDTEASMVDNDKALAWYTRALNLEPESPEYGSKVASVSEKIKSGSNSPIYRK